MLLRRGRWNFAGNCSMSSLNVAYWYLATPYSKYPGGIEAAFILACRAAADLIRAGVRVYSPIVHTHPIAIHGGIDPYDHKIWLPAATPFLKAATGLLVLRAESWEQSYGIAEEIKAFDHADKPILYMDPGIVPVGLGALFDV